ncbi:hypothetical protein NQ315_005010, partial [Exocentrus adspersus]
RYLHAETDITSQHEGSSDHNPVLGDPAPQGDIIDKRNTDWANFRAEMQRNTAVPRIETTDDLETAVRNQASKLSRRDTLGGIAAHLRQARSEAESLAFRSPITPKDSEPAIQKDSYFISNTFFGQKNLKPPKRTRRRPFPPLHGEQVILQTNRDKAEVFGDSLELQSRENQLDDEDEEYTALVERRTRQISQTPDDEEIHSTTPEEIEDTRTPESSKSRGTR